jgi:hypothetical protein
MKLGSRRLKVIVLIVLSVTLCVGLYTYSGGFGWKSDVSAEAKLEYPLTSPAWVISAVAGSTSIEQEAGIAIWLNATAHYPLDLTAAKIVMINIENDTSDYVIGSLKWTGIPSSDDYPHCFVSRSGWIVVYYLKVNEANPLTTGWIGKIIDWQYYMNKQLTDNLLHKGLQIMSDALGVAPITSAKYCHFRYPEATNLLIAIKGGVGGTSSSFNLFIPADAAIHEASWSCLNVAGYYLDAFRFDDTLLRSGRTDGIRHYGTIAPPSKLVWHTVTADDCYYCILLLYS